MDDGARDQSHILTTPFNSVPLSTPSSVQQWADASRVFVDVLQPGTQIPHAFFDNPASAAEPATSRVATATANVAPSPTASSTTQLRRKPNLNSTATPPILPPARTSSRRSSSIAKSPSVPTFQTKADDADDRPTTSYSTANPPLSRTRSNSTANRSPSRRKPPASHSSYGIETSCGPPPSYSTQRTLSQDRLWKSDSASRVPTKGATEAHEVFIAEEDQRREATEVNPEPVTPDAVSSPETIDTQSIATPKGEDQPEAASAMAMSAYGIHIHNEDQDRTQDQTIRASGLVPADEESKGSSSDERKSEDLFLNIARTDGAGQDQVSRAEKRRSRISLPFFSARSSIQKFPSPTSTDFDPALLSPKAELPNYYSKRSSLGQHTVTAASAHPLDEPQRPRTQGGRSTSIATRSVIGRDFPDNTSEASRSLSRRYSNAATEANFRGNMRSSIPARTNRLVSEPNTVDRPQYTGHPTTESTISTTAPSTVWDELDDLKSRIRKLELTGKLPSSSAAAMSSAERPRTATTAATTLSSSPKNNKPTVSTMQSAIEGIPTTVHPLLHEALGQARPVLSNDVYQKLQATASDALQLVAMMNGDNQAGAGSTSFGMSSASERQIRRRAESMCRGLTELTIALSAEPKSAVSPSYRPGSRDASSTLNTGFVSRRLSNEASDLPPVTSRVQSRLETRRTSLNYATNRTGYSSPDTAVHTPNIPPPRHTPSSSGMQRTSTLIRNRRAQGYVDGSADEDNASPSIRPVSRAMTDIGGAYRHSPRDRVNASREYTSQHPMPTQYEGLVEQQQRTPLPAGLGSNFHMRRKYTTPASVVGTQDSSPVTPRERESFGRISLIPRADVSVSSTDVTPENVTVTRGSGGSRRSLGLASRIGSSVGSRLRAVRAERSAQQKQQQEVASSPPQQMPEAPAEGMVGTTAGGAGSGSGIDE